MEILSLFQDIKPNIFMVFGLLLLFGILGGIISNRFKWLPTITAFMIVGLLFGPYGANIITKEMLRASSVLIDIALGLILYKLGTMLHPMSIIRSKALTLTSLAEAGITFLAVSVTVSAFGYSAITSFLVGAIAISSSPAVLVHVAEETRAAGKVTETAKSLVAMNNLLSFLIFTLVLPFAIHGDQISILNAFEVSLFRCFTALAIGLGVAFLACKIAHFLQEDTEHYKFVLIIGAIMLSLGLSKMLDASALFSSLTLGMATTWLEPKKKPLSHIHLGEGGDLFFIILFVMAGAKMNLVALASIGLLPIFLALVRSTSKLAGIVAVRRVAGYSEKETTSLTFLLCPMAGMAIGLVATLNHLVPEIDTSISVIVFSMVAIFETVGPFMATYAFNYCGEAGKNKEAKVTAPDLPPIF